MDQDTALLQLKGVSASWYKTGAEVTLKDVSMEVNPGQLCVIGGPVGSGKVSRENWTRPGPNSFYP